MLFWLATEGTNLIARNKHELARSRLRKGSQAPTIQKEMRRHLDMNRYRNFRNQLITLQCHVRRQQALKRIALLLFTMAARIQTLCRGVLGRIWVEANRALLVKEGQGRHARRASDFRRNQSNHAAEVDAHAAEVESLRLEKEDFLRQKKEMEDMKKEMEDFQRQRKEMEGNAAP